MSKTYFRGTSPGGTGARELRVVDWGDDRILLTIIDETGHVGELLLDLGMSEGLAHHLRGRVLDLLARFDDGEGER